jgi:hypothetical protein
MRLVARLASRTSPASPAGSASPASLVPSASPRASLLTTALAGYLSIGLSGGLAVALSGGLSGCSFSGSSGSPDAGPDAPPDGNPDGPPQSGRRMALRIPAGRVTAPLIDFPVYVHLTSQDLRARLDAAATLLSFTTATGAVLAHEIERFDKATGELAAWVRMNLDSSAETRFELRYGVEAVKAPPDLPGVWRAGYEVVFHFEQEPVNGQATVVNSANPERPGTPAGLESNDRVAGVLGKAYDFDGGNEEVAFTNPLAGAGPSTISFWFRDTESTPSDDAILVLGTAADSQARYVFNEINTNKLPVGLRGDDWTKPNVPTLAGWALVHWVYDDQQSRLYVDGVEAEDSPFAHAAPAATAGDAARIGNAPPGFGDNLGLRGSIDEVRVSDVARGPAWVAAELANQKEPSMFVIAGAPEDL